MTISGRFKRIDPSIDQIKTNTPAIKVGDTFIVGGIGGNFIPNTISGTDTTDGNIQSDIVLSGYIGYNSAGKVIGSIPILSGGSHDVGPQGYVLSSGVYLGGDQVFVGGQDITLGVAVQGASGILFQPLTFSGTEASDYGEPQNVDSTLRTWNTGHPAPSSSYNVSLQGSCSITIASGAVLSGVNAAGQNCIIEVQAGGSAINTAISQGASMTISSGGYANSTSVSSDATFTVMQGGIVQNTSYL